MHETRINTGETLHIDRIPLSPPYTHKPFSGNTVIDRIPNKDAVSTAASPETTIAQNTPQMVARRTNFEIIR
jgi:hypothetical protein